jgi:RNA polymerase sigma-70 factor (ECF subfamily)
MVVRKPARTGSRPEAEERLLVEAAQRDPRRFGELYERNFERVYAYVARRVQNRDTAEDLTSDVFHKALAKLPDFDWRGIPFAAWLFRIAANVIADQWKRSAREVVEDPPEMSAEMPLEEIDQQARLFRMVEALPTEQRRVVQARFTEGKSIREIAQELRKTEGAVKQLQFRALEKLRAEMEGAHG